LCELLRQPALQFRCLRRAVGSGYPRRRLTRVTTCLPGYRQGSSALH
jgi:hypothetical protein